MSVSNFYAIGLLLYLCTIDKNFGGVPFGWVVIIFMTLVAFTRNPTKPPAYSLIILFVIYIVVILLVKAITGFSSAEIIVASQEIDFWAENRNNFGDVSSLGSFFSYGELLENLFFHVKLILASLCVVVGYNSRINSRQLGLIATTFLGIQALVVMGQVIGNDSQYFRHGGTFGNTVGAQDLATWSVMMFVTAFFFVKKKVLLVLAAFFLGTILFFSLTRSAIAITVVFAIRQVFGIKYRYLFLIYFSSLLAIFNLLTLDDLIYNIDTYTLGIRYEMIINYILPLFSSSKTLLIGFMAKPMVTESLYIYALGSVGVLGISILLVIFWRITPAMVGRQLEWFRFFLLFLLVQGLTFYGLVSVTGFPVSMFLIGVISAISIKEQRDYKNHSINQLSSQKKTLEI